MTKKITRAKGGTHERTVDVDDIVIPDMWHIAMAQKDERVKEAILEIWHLAHDLLRHIKEEE